MLLQTADRRGPVGWRPLRDKPGKSLKTHVFGVKITF